MSVQATAPPLNTPPLPTSGGDVPASAVHSGPPLAPERQH
jgi:hypothetical protein